jgi:hypothetical protein
MEPLDLLLMTDMFGDSMTRVPTDQQQRPGIVEHLTSPLYSHIPLHSGKADFASGETPL